MEMILHYKDLEYNGAILDDDGIHTYYGTNITDYDFKVEIYDVDVIDFLISEIGKSVFDKWDIEKRNGFKRAVEMMFDKNLIGETDLTENQSFIDFMEEAYREDAEIECQEYWGD